MPVRPTIETLARRLARSHELGTAPRRAGRRLRRTLDVLERAHEAITHELHGRSADEDLGSPVEWILENQHLVAEALLQVKEDLAPGFYAELPRLAGTGRRDVPRILAIARAIVQEGGGHLDPDRARRFLLAYQTVSPLTMGELWAFPAVVRLGSLEDLIHAASRLTDVAFRGRSEFDRLDREHREVPVEERIPAGIGALRAADAEDWLAFFEETSRVDRVLRRGDPSGHYAEMDFGTRDRYRKAVEEIAARSGLEEEEVARRAIRSAEESEAGPGDVARHVGYFLVGDGRRALEAEVGYSPPLRQRLLRLIDRRSVTAYLGSIGLLALVVLVGLLLPLRDGGAGAVTVGIFLGLVPAVSVAVAVVNGVVTRVLPPRVLPKLAHERGIPDDSRTVVAIPCLLSGRAEIEHLIQQLELNYQGNRDRNLRFALLSDFTDAEAAEVPGDRELADEAAAAVRRLNREYSTEDEDPRFHLFHRSRRWNPAEGVWMGWERKRGKLSEFNRLILGDQTTDFRTLVGSPDAVHGARYLITLDADTFLPQGAARRLVGTLDHPLNQPRLGDDGRLASGYTVLQPRVETYTHGESLSLFARIYQADRGLDLYSHAVSDVYQDLFGTGIFAGKGIYHVEAFERTLRDRVPENTLLSHDLFEGLHGRAALVTDIMVFEDFPDQVLAYAKRLHRWVRGDWQLLPWLLPKVPAAEGRRVTNPFGILGRWMLTDNLRRSLLAPSLTVLLLAGWLVLPGPWWWWTVGVALVLGTPVLLGSSVFFRARAGISSRWAPLREQHQLPAVGFLRWCVGLAFLPFQAYVELDAILRTFHRLLVSRRHLLEWTTQAHTAQALSARGSRRYTWIRMSPGPALAVVSAAGLALANPSALLYVTPLLGAWIVSPEVARHLSRRPSVGDEDLEPEDEEWLRLLTRRTWGYFERFVGPEDNWLPPDHFQEEPRGEAAHRTSPTNIGLMLGSTLGAYDMGYLSLSGLVATIRSSFDTMAALERHRGHFLNWYDTRDLRSLTPRYVSMVDSGNLAATLLALKEGLEEIPSTPLVRPALWSGLSDSLGVLREAVGDLAGSADGSAEKVVETIDGVREGLLRPPREGETAAGKLARLTRNEGPALEEAVGRFVSEASRHTEPGAVSHVRGWLVRFRHEAARLRDDLDVLVPWAGRIPEIEAWRSAAGGGEAGSALDGLRRTIPARVTLRSLPAACRKVGRALERVTAAAAELEGGRGEELAAWSRGFRSALDRALDRAGELTGSLTELAGTAERWVDEMDFSFLYDRQSHLFHVGYNVTQGELDRSYYDLLASEARVGSLVAIAKGDAPAEHWLHLGRPFGKVDGSAVLLSWAGTAFEYLMPLLLNRNPRGTLLDLNVRAAVRSHRAYARRHRIPWGISESGYYEFDAHGTYQYRAFGVPELGIRRDPGARAVVSPYASALALPVAPTQVVRNLRRLEELGAAGTFGFYEAVDYGRVRKRSTGPPRTVRSYMAHHQGMIFLALVNRMRNGVMIERFHRDPGIRAVEFLLHERAPRQVRLEPPTPEPVSPGFPTPGPADVEGWEVTAEDGPPDVHYVSNGSMTSFLTAEGGGGIRWKGRAATPWGAPSAEWRRGLRLYLRDEESGRSWTATPAVGEGEAGEEEVLFAPHQAEYVRRLDEVMTRLLVTVPPGADVEIRRLILRNESRRTRRLRVTSYGEVALADPDRYARHPAFEKLFVDALWNEELQTLLFRRRKARPDEPGVHLAHALEAAEDGPGPGWWETDREHFVGRWNRSDGPAALDPGWQPRSLEGAPIDPIFSISRLVELRPGAKAEILGLTAVGSTRSRVLGHLDAYRSPARARWAFEQARTQARLDLSALGLHPTTVPVAQKLLSAALYPFHPLRSRAPTPETTARRDLLWGLGVSGDHPVILSVVEDPDDAPVVADLIRIHARWRSAGIQADLVILDDVREGYEQPLRDRLTRILSRTRGEEARLGTDGGVHHVPAGRLSPDQRQVLEATAAVLLDGNGPPLAEQLAAARKLPERLPPFVATAGTEEEREVTGPAPPEELALDNGFGGFRPDGSEYVIRVRPERPTPAPWINVVATPDTGFLVTERGSGYTWAGNSGEYRLTRWSNDPVRDPATEALYLRDESSGRVWSPTPGPAGLDRRHTVAHGAGYTRISAAGRGLRWEVSYFLAREERTKVVELTLENVGDEPRRLTAAYYAEWVLGALRRDTAPHLITEWLAGEKILVASNQRSPSPGPSVAYLASDAPVMDWTCDRAEFLGRGGLSAPAGLTRIGLAETRGAALDPCGVLQVEVSLDAGQRRSVRFFLGAAEDRETTTARIRALRQPGTPGTRRESSEALWDDLLGALSVSTPDPAMDLLLNRWALYQAVSCRLWGRSAFYQSSGAFGFRDQLQDVLALLHAAPELAREHILEAARHQFVEGDVLHWWHPPGGEGVRTRCSDDLLWLPFALCTYLAATGDEGILDERVPFLTGPELDEGEDERYGRFARAEEEASLFEHAVRALRRGLTAGPNGLPLIRGGDWNDGMDRVGTGERGESVWLAWFSIATARRFADVCDRTDNAHEARWLRQKADGIEEAVREVGWDGAWYLRAFYDDGTPLGSASRREGQIDSIAQSWAALSGAGEPDRVARALDAAEERLVREEDRLVALLDPPFDRSGQWPGYIRAYPPGIRENGGQYTHAATWLGWAFASRGEADRAMRIFRILNPLNRAADREGAEHYRVEPYAVAGDIGSASPHVGRGGWSWYTGSASWLYRLGIEAILGLKPAPGGLIVDPCIPPAWPGFEATRRCRGGTLEIRVENPDGVPGGVESITLDGRPLEGCFVPLPEDGDAHDVVVRLGGSGSPEAGGQGAAPAGPVLPRPLRPPAPPDSRR